MVFVGFNQFKVLFFKIEKSKNKIFICVTIPS